MPADLHRAPRAASPGGAGSFFPFPLLSLLSILTACGAPAGGADAGVADDPRVAYCITTHACSLVALKSLSDCVASGEAPPPSVSACIVAAGWDCGKARACLYDAHHPSLCGFGQHPACDGNVALTCDGQTTTTSQTDCSLVHETCIAGPIAAKCARAGCDQPPGPAYCLGSVAAQCARPFLVGIDCAALGANCMPSPVDGGAASCTGTDEVCIVPQCDNKTTLALCLNGHRGVTHCPTGTRCFPANATIDHPTCGIAGACDPNTHFDRCVDGKLEFCRLGRSETLDCRALGYAGCQSSPSSGCVLTFTDGGRGPILTDGPVM